MNVLWIWEGGLGFKLKSLGTLYSTYLPRDALKKQINREPAWRKIIERRGGYGKGGWRRLSWQRRNCHLRKWIVQQSYEAHLLHPVCDMNALNVPYASYKASLPPPPPLTSLCYNKWIWHLNQGIINLFVWHVTRSWLKILSSSVMSYVLSMFWGNVL